jgi:hypothetical protein
VIHVVLGSDVPERAPGSGYLFRTVNALAELPAMGNRMPYVVKWVLASERHLREWPTTFATPSEAVDFACTVLRQKPRDIWIEGPSGVRIDQDVIMRNCSARGLV